MIASSPCLDIRNAMVPEAHNECAPMRERECPLSVALTRAALEQTGKKSDSPLPGGDVAASPVFLEIHDERHRGGGCEDGCEDCCVAGGREQGLALPKMNVADTKLHSASRKMLRWDPQQEIKRYNYEVGCCRLVGLGEALGSLRAAAARAIAWAGSATWGFGAGSRSWKDLRRSVKGRAKSVLASGHRGLGNPSSTKACAT